MKKKPLGKFQKFLKAFDFSKASDCLSWKLIIAKLNANRFSLFAMKLV